MTVDVIPVRNYPSHAEGKQAQAALEAHGILAVVVPAAHGDGVQVCVRNSEVARAYELLESADEV